MAEQHTFNHWFKQLRAKQDLTQEMLAEQTGCAVATISAFERGRRRPSRAMAERLADVLQVPASERAEFLRLARAQTGGVEQQLETNAEDGEQASSASHDVGRPLRVVHIPPPATPLIGRAVEEAEICRRLRDPDCRLLTLVGAGGTGKTRLALQIAEDLSAQFADGVAFVALAPIVAAEYVAVAIADALGCPLLATRTPDESVIQFLRDRDFLLVLDNLEHLLDAAPFITAIVRDAPSVRLLITSRERLRVQSEWVVEVAGLALPHDDSRHEIDHADAVLLFVERARRVAGEFTITVANRTTITKICHLLNGAPLAIELAAAWVRALTPDEIIAELTRGLDFLQLSNRDTDPRHRSMRAVIDHSWALLTLDERRVMACLSVFRGGCLRPAAEAVALATLPTLLALLDKSLLHRTPSGRYELHELVRQYAAEQLAADPDEAVVAHERHCGYYASWVHEHDALLRGPQQQIAFAQFTAEIDNLRAAWYHAVDQRQVEALWSMQEGGTLVWFYELRSWYQEGETLCRHAVARLQSLPARTRWQDILIGSLTGVQGWFTARNGNAAHGIMLLERSLELLRPGEVPTLLYFTLVQLVYLLLLNGEFERAVVLTNEAHGLAQRIEGVWLRAHAAFQQAVVYVDQMPETAYVRFHEGMPAIRAGGDRYHLLLSLIHLGEVALVLGKIDEAEQLFTEALAHSTEVGNGVGEVSAHTGLAQVAAGRGAWTEAVMHARTAVLRYRSVGDQLSGAKALVVLGEAEAGSGDLGAAHQTFREAISVSLAARALPTAIDAWLGLATLDVQNDLRNPSLLTLLALVRRHAATRRPSVERAEHLWAMLSTLVNPSTLADAEACASTMASMEVGQVLEAYDHTGCRKRNSGACHHAPEA